MDEVDRRLQELDDEIVQSAALVHRREYPLVRRTSSPALRALRAMLDTPDGRFPRPSEELEPAIAPATGDWVSSQVASDTQAAAAADETETSR